MNIDLTKLNSGLTTSIDLEEKISFPTSYFVKSQIEGVDNIMLVGRVFRDSDDNLMLVGTISGAMIIQDAISLDSINYPFTCDIEEELEENLEKSTNTLDILDILWQNIMLEVPLKLTNVKDFKNYQGDGWKLVDEEELKTKKINPFSELIDMMGEE